MEFGKVAAVSVTSTCIQVTVTITTAWAGESYLSMAWGSIAGNICNILVLSIMQPQYALLPPKWSGIQDVIRFGSKSSTISIVSELGASGPDLILGRTLGFNAVAFFSRAMSLNNMVYSKFIAVIKQVYFPAFASGIRRNVPPSELYYQWASLFVGMAAPLAIVLAILADIIILLLFGPQWQQAASLAPALCAMELIRAPTVLAPPALIASGHIDTIMRCNIMIQAVILFTLSLSIWLGLEHVVYALVFARVVETSLLLSALRRHLNLNLPLLWQHIKGGYQLIAFAAVGPILLRLWTEYSMFKLNAIFLLGFSTTLAAIGLMLGIFLIQHPLQAEINRMLSSFLKWP
jgi:O-antigen/teichoic acid export membrane protein